MISVIAVFPLKTEDLMFVGFDSQTQVKSLTEKRPVLGRCFRLLDSPRVGITRH